MTNAAGKRRSGLIFTLAAFGGLGACAAASAAPTGSVAPAPTQPTVLYTDIASGPNSGGENGNGAYLSIFGRNFGAAGLGSRVKVTIGGAEVASYRYLGPSKGRSDVQQITVQVGALTGQALGTPLPV